MSEEAGTDPAVVEAAAMGKAVRSLTGMRILSLGLVAAHAVVVADYVGLHTAHGGSASFSLACVVDCS